VAYARFMGGTPADKAGAHDRAPRRSRAVRPPWRMVVDAQGVVRRAPRQLGRRVVQGVWRRAAARYRRRRILPPGRSHQEPTAGRTAAPAAPPDRLRWVIATAVPSARVGDRWGDWHLAHALRRSLERLGQDVVVQTLEDAGSRESEARDVKLVLRGLASIERNPGQRHVLWLISHPEAVDLAECEAADLVVVASPRFAAHLRERVTTPVEVLLQATDAERFFPRPPMAAHQHPVTVVAKSRDVLRGAVVDAIEAGLEPAVYGGGWRGRVDRRLVVASHVANEALPIVYSSAGVVLNDHWEAMRTWGFVSNRIFDVLACGTPVISDDLPELRELFDGAVLTYRSSTELRELVAAVLADREASRAVAATGRAAVLARHTFDHRARELLDLAVRHGLIDGER